MNEYSILEDYIEFECGCSFPYKNGELQFYVDLRDKRFNIDFECKKTWENLSAGLTEGVFQLCSPLGNQFCKKLAPENLENISALGAILRPGCMESKDEKGDSTTIHYIRRKNGREEVPKYNDIVDDILKNDYGLNIYQESSIKLVVACAGFTESEADTLRRGIGKKKVEVVQECKKMFLEKAKVLGILDDKQAEEVFNSIEASQRYAFNRSHSMCYGIRGYNCIYIKTHFPIFFYKSALKIEDKREKYAGFVNEAKLFDITVNPPNIQHMKPLFYSIKKNIYFGLSSIKGILKGDIDKISQLLQEKGWFPLDFGNKITWMMFMSNILYNISSRTADGLIHSGALDCFGMPRAVMAIEYEYYCLLTPTERRSLAEELSLEELLCKTVNDYQQRYKKSMVEWNEGPKTKRIKTLTENGKAIICTSAKKQKKVYTEHKQRLTDQNIPFEEIETEIEILPPKPNQRLAVVSEILHKLQHPLYNVVDTLDSLIFSEEDLLGVALTRHATNAIANAAQTHSCMDIMNGYKGRAVIKVKIDSARPWACKNGSQMCFLKVSDETCVIEAICFSGKPEDEKGGYQNFRHLLTTSNIVFLSGQLGEKGSFIINRVNPVA